MNEAQVMEFPGFADLPRREKSKLQRLWDATQEMSRVTEEKGLMMPQAVAARLLGVSRARVNELVKLGRLECYEFEGVPMVLERSLVDFAKTERKTGRPCKVVTSMGEVCIRVLAK